MKRNISNDSMQNVLPNQNATNFSTFTNYTHNRDSSDIRSYKVSNSCC